MNDSSRLPGPHAAVPSTARDPIGSNGSDPTVLMNRSPFRFTSPAQLLLLIVLGIFVAELAEEIIIYLLQPRSFASAILLDALTMAVLIFPLLFFLSFRPLLQQMERLRHADRVLRAAHRRLQELESIIDQSLAVAFLWRNTSGRPVEFVSKNVRNYGYTPEDLLEGRVGFEEILHPQDRERVIREVRAYAQQSRVEFAQEYRILTRTGEVRWVDNRTWARAAVNGRITHYEGVLFDITERKQAEEALADERGRLHKLLDQLPAYVYLQTPDYTVKFANRRFRERFGDPAGKCCYQFIQKRDQPCVGCQTMQVFQTQSPCEWEWTAADGTVYRAYAYPLVDNGGSSVLELGIDVTELKQAQQSLQHERDKLKSILDAIPDGVYIVDQQHEVHYVNPVVEQAFGPIAGRKCHEYLYERQDTCPWCKNDEVFAGNPVTWESFSHRIGRHYELFDTPLLNADGSIVKLKIFHDITERKQAAEQLERQNRELLRLGAAEHRQRRLAEGLVQAAVALNSSLDLNQVLDCILEQTCRAIPCTASGVGLLKSNVLHTARWQGLSPASCPVDAVIAGWSIDTIQALLEVLRTAQPLVVADVTARPNPLVLAGFEWVRSFVIVPLKTSAHILGFLGVLSDQAGVFEQEHVEHLTAFAAHAAVAIHNAQLYAAELLARQVAETLSAATRALTETLRLDTVTNALLEHLERLVPYDSACIALLEGESYLVVRAVRGHTSLLAPERVLGTSLNLRTAPHLRTLLAERKSLIISDTLQAPWWEPSAGAAPVLSWLGVPLVVGGEVTGVCCLDKGTPAFFTQEHAALAEMLVSQAAVALQNACLFEEVLAARERLQYLSRRLVEVQEHERSYVARELHDEASQFLAFLKLGLGAMAKDPDCNARMFDQLEALRNITDQVMGNLHQLAVDLRPASLDHVGLVAALRQYINSIPQAHLALQFTTVGFEGDRVPTFVETALYRIVQEALVNVVRHAHAGHVGVLLERRHGVIRVFVEDDGVGFDPGQVKYDRLGIVGMRERAEMLGGTLLVESALGKGTTVCVEIPDVYPCADTG